MNGSWGILEELEWNWYFEPHYENFISFVKNELAPHMGMPFQEEDYYEELWNEFWSNQYLLEELPRGHTKTEFFGVWMTIWIGISQATNPFSGLRIKEQQLIAAEGKALKILGNRIKHFFYANPKLQRYKPARAGINRMVTGWDMTEMYLSNGSIIHLRELGGNIRGTHNDRVYADDLITERQTIKDEQVCAIWDGAIDGITTAKTAMVQITGTPLRFTDILFHLKNKPGYCFKMRPAITDWDAQEILSPKRWSWAKLMATKDRIGSLRFSTEYMLNPIDDNISLIKRPWIIQCRDENHSCYRHRAHFDAIYLGWDFAFSDKATADYAAGIIIGKYNDQFYLLDYIRLKGLSGIEQMQRIQELHAVYKFDMIGLEENSIKAITKEIKQLGLPIKLFRTGNIDEKDKITPDLQGTISVSKRNLIMRIGTTFENKSIVLPYKTDEDKAKMDMLLNECVSYAQEDGKIIELGIHPDGPIGLGYALESATKVNWIIDSL